MNASIWLPDTLTAVYEWGAGTFHSNIFFSGWYYTPNIGYCLPSIEAINTYPFVSVFVPVILKKASKDGYFLYKSGLTPQLWL